MSPLERKRPDDDEPGGGSGLHVDLEDRACAECRRALPSWVARCPDCGGEAVAVGELQPADDPLLRRFLDDPGAGDDLSDDR